MKISTEISNAASFIGVAKTIELIAKAGFDASPLAGNLFLVTGTGKFFKNVSKEPQNNLGIVKIADNGAIAQLLWGFEDGGRFTSEFPAHMMSISQGLKSIMITAL